MRFPSDLPAPRNTPHALIYFSISAFWVPCHEDAWDAYVFQKSFHFYFLSRRHRDAVASRFILRSLLASIFFLIVIDAVMMFSDITARNTGCKNIASRYRVW